MVLPCNAELLWFFGRSEGQAACQDRYEHEMASVLRDHVVY